MSDSKEKKAEKGNEDVKEKALSPKKEKKGKGKKGGKVKKEKSHKKGGESEAISTDTSATKEKSTEAQEESQTPRRKEKGKKKSPRTVAVGEERGQSKQEPLQPLFNVSQLKKTDIKHNILLKDMPVSSVCVYTDRAEITRALPLDIQTEGVQQIIVNNVSPNTDVNSVRVISSGEAIILDVSYSTVRGSEAESSNTTVVTLSSLEEEKEKLNAELQRLDARHNWLKGFAKEQIKVSADPSTNPPPLSPEQAATFLSFYRQELKHIYEETRSLQNKIHIIDRKMEIQRKEDDKGDKRNSEAEQAPKTFVISFFAKVGKCELDFAYLISGASWLASYDVRVEGERCCLTYYASITNETGEDWTNSDLALSTAVPTSGGKPPTLTVNTIQVTSRPISRRNTVFGGLTGLLSAGGGESAAKESTTIGSAPSTPKAGMDVIQGATSATFQIKGKHSVPSDKKPHKMTVMAVRLDNVRFSYVAVPVKRPVAFLRAKMENTSDYPLLPGPISVFSGNNFVSMSQLDFTNQSETFDVFLGADSDIKVSFVGQKKKGKAGGITSKYSTQTCTHLVTIKNNKKTPIVVEMRDQFPISGDKDVKVKLLQPSEKTPKLTRDDTSPLGNFLWTHDIGDGEEKKIKYEYMVEWPEGKSIVIDDEE